VSLDIVIPAHNEEQRIDRTLRAYRAGFPQDDVRFLVALDGCEDATSDVVRAHAVQDDRVVLHEFPKLGKGGVLMETFRRTDADLVAFVDADCATPPAELARMTELADETDGVIASRRLPASFTPCSRRRGRSLTSSGFAWGVRHLFNLPYADTQCGAKVIHRRVVDRVVPLMSSRDFLFDVDLLLVADRLGFEMVEVPTVWIDQAGSKLSAAADASRMLKSALRLWIHHRTMPVGPASGVPVRGAGTALGSAPADAGSPERVDIHAA
jgi:glycosyltransferase involved in cell wall biosynthesis